MPILLNESDQLGVLFEVISTRGDWVFSHIALQHYLPKENDFATWVEAYMDTYITDYQCLVRNLSTLAENMSVGHKFAFEPQVEPSFEFCFQVESTAQRGEVLASIALDIKCILNLTTAAGYRENRISLRFLTDRERVHRFSEQVSLEAARFLRSR